MNMMHTLAPDTEEVIDKRIVKEEYRNYDLVARFWEYGYLGKIWKQRKAVDEVEAEGDQGIDDLVRVMKARVDALIDEKCRERGNRAPDAAELTQALRMVLPRLSPMERGVLKLAASGDAELSMEALQKATGFSSAATVLMVYGNIAQRLCDELGWWPSSTGAHPALSLLFKPVGKTPRSLCLKKDAARALRDLLRPTSRTGKSPPHVPD